MFINCLSVTNNNHRKTEYHVIKKNCNHKCYIFPFNCLCKKPSNTTTDENENDKIGKSNIKILGKFQTDLTD